MHRNEVLFEIDPRPFQAALDQANAAIAQQVANERRAAHDVERDRPLAEAHAIPKSQLETDVEGAPRSRGGDFCGARRGAGGRADPRLHQGALAD